ncbi:MAG: lipoyl(octanoyl) transferase LipB [Candidatus Omnitrophica bacterium]|jgi:lipoate-protein ligase B|nr:lipoyl(octanoyl) transferase LipB [Candidatus Omnitrophota bacterium]
MSFEVFDLGLIDYQKALVFQQEVFKAVESGLPQFALILCSHYPVITCGRQANKKNILVPAEELVNRGISVFETSRGGDVTYHGPGQLIIYPVVNLAHFKKDIHWFLRLLEEVVIDLLSDFGVEGRRIEGKTGVWVGEAKICSVGIAIRGWISFHGLSINVKAADLDNFNLIRACGMDVNLTSLETILGRNIEISDISKMGSELFISKIEPGSILAGGRVL